MEESQPISIEWAVTCDHALVDAQGKISLIGIFDRLFTPSFPALHPVLFLAACWRAQPGQLIAAELRIWSPTQEVLASIQQQLAFGPEGRSTGVFQMAPLPLPAPGEYVFDLFAGGHSLRQVRLSVATPPSNG